MKERKQKLTHKVRCYGYLNIKYNRPYPHFKVLDVKKFFELFYKRGLYEDIEKTERQIWRVYLPSKKIKFK